MSYCDFEAKILRLLCLASLGLEGIGSSSFTFDSLAAHNICFCPQNSWAALPRFAWPWRYWIKLVYIWLSRQLIRIAVDSRAALPRFARPWRDWIKLVYIWLSRGSLFGSMQIVGVIHNFIKCTLNQGRIYNFFFVLILSFTVLYCCLFVILWYFCTM